MKFISIQSSIQCEPCKDCGARPVVEQFPKNAFIVRCPNSSSHFQTKKGKVDIDAWNRFNKPASNIGLKSNLKSSA